MDGNVAKKFEAKNNSRLEAYTQRQSIAAALGQLKKAVNADATTP